MRRMQDSAGNPIIMAGRELERFMRERKRAYDKNNLKEAASICNNIGVHYSQMGNHHKALKYHIEERQLSESINDKLGVAVGHRKVGECLAELGRFSESLREEEQYLNIAEDLQSREEIQRAYATIGRIWYERYKEDDSNGEESVGVAKYLEKASQAYILALKACDSLVGVVSEKELNEMKGRLHLNLGLVAEDNKDLESAEKHYEEACSLSKMCDCHKLTWQSLFNFAGILISARTPNRALVVLQESLRFSEKSKSKHDKSVTLFQIAMVYVKLVDFQNAKKYLRLTLKVSDEDWSDAEYQQLIKKYKLVNKILSLIQSVSTEGVYDVREKIKVYDRLGDMCANKDYEFYEAAVKFYQKELQLAEVHGFELKDISRICFSIAETYCDNRQYEESLEYHQKELQMWQGHPSEEACSWANMARVYESANDEKNAILAYHTAIELASSVNDYKSLIDTYDSLVSYCSTTPDLEEQTDKYQEKLDTLLAEHPELKRPIKREGSEEATPLDSEDLREELVLSSSESEVEEEEIGLVDHTHQTRQLRGMAVRRRAKHSKRNEKGETPLHVAAISNQLNRVKDLLADGADVNARDYCGWTPLHEACNHGNLGVVDSLLSHGADINDVGGIHCNMITPLMDAVSNGHVGVVSLLLERGADISIKNKEGKCALDIVLDALVRDKDDIDYMDIKDKLIQATGRAPGLQRQSTLSVPPVAIVHPLQQDIENTLPSLIPVVSDEEEEGEVGGVIADKDGWLLDDLAPPNKKRRTHPLTRRLSNHSNQNHSNQNQFTQKRRSNPLDVEIEPFWNEDSNSSNPVLSITPTQSPCPLSHVLPSPNHSLAPPTQLVAPPTHSSFVRIKVRLDDGTFLVPCPWQQDDGAETTIGSLAEAASDRYFHQHGRRPILSLTTSEGAFLFPTDRLIEVLQEGDQVVGVVKHWETPPIAQHYESVCDRFKSSVHSGLLQLFQSSSSPTLTSLSFSNMSLQPKHSPSLCQTLLAYPSLSSLSFSGVFLTDSSLSHLGKLLSNLPTLYHLDLSCTGITSTGLQSLSHALTTQTTFTTPTSNSLSLKSLKLSHNELGPFVGSSLSLLLSRTPSLTHLSLADCGITGYTLEAHTGFTGILVRLAELQELVLDQNHIGDSICCLSDLKLSSLSLNSVISTTCTIKLPISVLNLSLSCCPLGGHNLLSLSSCFHLQSLDISGSITSSDDVESLVSSIASLSNLTKLDLSANRSLGNAGCTKVIGACKQTRLQVIYLMDCNLLSPLEDTIIQFMSQLKLNIADLRYNDISIGDRERLNLLLAYDVYL